MHFITFTILRVRNLGRAQQFCSSAPQHLGFPLGNSDDCSCWDGLTGAICLGPWSSVWHLLELECPVSLLCFISGAWAGGAATAVSLQAASSPGQLGHTHNMVISGRSDFLYMAGFPQRECSMKAERPLTT